MHQKPVITRLPPSPTGLLHIGTARTALFNFLFARQHGGKFIMRIEDTDRERSKKEYEDNILEGLAWLGLSWDDFSRQTDHHERHSVLLQQLIDGGKAYVSREPSKADPAKEVDVVRLRNHNGVVVFDDVVRGTLRFDTTELGDFVIARSTHEPLYHFAVVADDQDAGVTHVIRGEDHISNTARQILIQEALGFTRPIYAHIPLILAPDRSKLSKRRGAVSLNEYRDAGYLPEALVNYLALLGWNPGTEQELFSLEELTAAFTLEGIQKSGAIFDIERLKWFNKEYLCRLSPEALSGLITGALTDDALRERMERSPAAQKDVLERIAIVGDVRAMEADGQLAFYVEAPTYDPHLLLPRKDPVPAHAVRRLADVIVLLDTLEETSFSYMNVKEAVWEYATKEGRGEVLWPMRTALSGKSVSPDPFTIAEAVGKKETISRLIAGRDTLAALTHESQ